MYDGLDIEKPGKDPRVESPADPYGSREDSESSSTADPESREWDSVMRHLGRILREGEFESFLGRGASSAADDPC